VLFPVPPLLLAMAMMCAIPLLYDRFTDWSTCCPVDQVICPLVYRRKDLQ
jgi:hypothetical protein